MDASDIDTLHILPLSQLPLEIQSLRSARMVKNARLESMVELFETHGSGSGQVPPHMLHTFYDFTGERARDYEILCQLGELPSYDVYSLRLSLRRLGIDIENLDQLKLSDAKIVELTQYMAEFTRPLVKFIYGEDAVQTTTMADMMRLFADPSATAARENLRKMSYLLEVDLMRIPKFLEDYADVYMSLSFYRQCLERIAPLLADVHDALHTIRATRSFANDHVLLHDCVLIETKLNRLFDDVSGVLDEFRRRTEDMWNNLSAAQYREMENLVFDHQTQIGEILCALTVKMLAWDRKFPVPGDGQLTAKAAFVISEIKHGLSRVEPLALDSDAKARDAIVPLPAAPRSDPLAAPVS